MNVAIGQMISQRVRGTGRQPLLIAPEAHPPPRADGATRVFAPAEVRSCLITRCFHSGSGEQPS